MAVAEPLPPNYRQLDYQLHDIMREIAADYSEETLKEAIKFTKGTLGGNFQKFPDNDIAPCLEELRNQGRITPQKTGFLEYYAKDNKSIEEKIKSLKSQSMKGRENESEFIGREEDVKAVVDQLTRGETMIMTLHGDSGVGKTTLADEVVDILKSQGHMASKKKVDLRKMRSQRVFCLAFLHAFESKKVLQPCMEFVYEAIEQLEDRTILILDNAEEVLSQSSFQESEVSFPQMLEGMVLHNKSKKLTILLTSRIPLQYEINGSVNYKVMPLNEAKSATFLEKSNLSLSSKEKNEIIDLCANKPLLLKLVRELMQENLLTGKIEHLKEVLNTLEKPAFANKKELAQYADVYNSNIFNEAFEGAFTPELQKTTIKLSLFQGTFTIEDAVKMVKQPKRETLFYLNVLKERGFLTEKIDDSGTSYEMHPSINDYMESECKKEGYEDIVSDAKETFFKNYLEKSKQIGQLLEKDYVRAYSDIEKDRLNLKLAVEISFEKGFLYFSSDYSESAILANLFLVLIPGLEREKLFREWSAVAEKKGDWICYSILVCMQITVLLEKTAGKSDARKLLGKVKEALKRINEKSSYTRRLVKSSYFYAKGEMLSSDCQSKGRKEEWTKVLEYYQNSLKIREELLKDHTDTARTLNAIGNCYMYLAELEKARDYYTRALEMRQRLSGSQLHVDMPVYINQIAATHEEMGQKYQRQAEDANLYYRKGLTERYRQEFNEALKKYQEALALEKKLHISGYINTAVFYRNVSNTYSFLEEYESSLRYAKKALFVRKKLLGIDSDTIRSYYQVGLAYERLDEIEKARKYFYKAYMMEQALPKGETSPVKERVIMKIENIGGSTEDAELEDKRHKEALQKKCLDDDILTSEDESEEKEEEEEEGPLATTVKTTDQGPLGITVKTADQGPLGTTVKTAAQGPLLTTVKTADQGPLGTTVKTAEQGPPGTTVKTTDQGSPGITQKEKETSDTVVDIEIEERVVYDRQVIGIEGFEWNIKETGVCILFLPGTVPSDTIISCHVYKEPEKQLLLEPTETLVSMVVRLDADNTVFDEAIGLLIPHSGAMRTKGYELVVKEYCEKSESWEEVADFSNIQHKTDLQNIDSKFIAQLGDVNLPAVLLTRQYCSTVCVTCRLVKDIFNARPAGSTLVSSVFPDVQLVLERNTVKKNTLIEMKVHPLPNFTVFNSPSLSCGPILYLQTGESESNVIHKPAQITLPHPLTWCGSCTERRGQVWILYNEYADSSIEWQDITDNPGTNLSVNGPKISLQVCHFSMFWPIWISDVKQDIQKFLNKAKEQFAIICRSAPFSAQFDVKCKPRIHKGQAILQCIAIPTHLVKKSKRDSGHSDSEEDLYDGEQIQIDLEGSIQSDPSPFHIIFSSRRSKTKLMTVTVEEEDGMFKSVFLRVSANKQCICEIPFELKLVPQVIGELKPLDFYGIPLEDPERKWNLLEAPRDVLILVCSNQSLQDVASKAFEINNDEESMKFFFQSVSYTDLQQAAFDALIKYLPEHVKQVLEAGKKVVEEPLDDKTARDLSKYIQTDYIKLAQAANLSAKCVFVKQMNGTSSDRCYFFLKTWISHQKPTLHILMQKLREVSCEKGMKALLEEFKVRLEKSEIPEASASESHNSLVVTVEGQYQEASTAEPLLAGQHIDTRQTNHGQATEGSSEVVQGPYVGNGDTDSPTCLFDDESNTHGSPMSDGATGSSLDDSSISASSSTSDSASSIIIIEDQTGRDWSSFYSGLCLVALSLGYVYFRYIRR